MERRIESGDMNKDVVTCDHTHWGPRPGSPAMEFSATIRNGLHRWTRRKSLACRVEGCGGIRISLRSGETRIG